VRRTVSVPKVSLPRVALPEGPPWDVPLAEAPLAFVDLEMTGLDPERDRVVEVCIERVVDGQLAGRLHSLVRPEGGETGNVHVHGIDAAAVATAPTFAELSAEMAALLEGAVFVAHGAVWDVAFLNAEFERAARSERIVHYLDTLKLSRRAFGLPKHSLDALREHFGLDAARAHRADGDVRALREVFARCIEALVPRATDARPTTPRDLWDVRIAEGHARAQILEQCQRAIAHGREVVVVYRAHSRREEPMRMVLRVMDTSHDPPKVIGYQLPGRGRRELRADRILRIDDEPRP
jgi:DNA polymerase-3 subunit epsilon